MPEPRKARILIIEDGEANRYILRRTLSRAGFVVDEASTGTEGLTQAMTLPDLILSDVNLPDMLGYEVCRRLRSNPLTVSIPVIQMSASMVSSESKAQALEGGADSYLVQPIEPEVLLAQVNALLRLRRAEATASLSARQWQTTFDSLSDGLALLDGEGVLVRANRTLLEQLSLSPSEAEGRPIAEIFASGFGMPFDEFLERSAREGSLERQVRNQCFRLTYNRIAGDPDQPGGAVLLVADITDHRKLQEMLRMSERLAATGRLAHIIAHEINNPLEAMSNLLYLTHLELADLADPAGTARGYLDQTSQELGRISRITKQVLAYHRESRHPTSTPSGDLLESVLAIFRSQMLASRVALQTDLRSTQSVEVYSGEVRQVFGNLIANALDAIDSGGTLRVRTRDTVDPRTHTPGVRFTISDTGSGIDAETFPRIFEAFYTTKENRGSGVGLWLSAEIIRKHHGRLQVRTRTAGAYRGTLFSVFLPLNAPRD